MPRVGGAYSPQSSSTSGASSNRIGFVRATSSSTPQSVQRATCPCNGGRSNRTTPSHSGQAEVVNEAEGALMSGLSSASTGLKVGIDELKTKNPGHASGVCLVCLFRGRGLVQPTRKARERPDACGVFGFRGFFGLSEHLGLLPGDLPSGCSDEHNTSEIGRVKVEIVP